MEPVFDEGARCGCTNFPPVCRAVRLADYALLAGAAAGLDIIDAAVVRFARGRGS